MALQMVVNLSEPRERRNLIEAIRALEGPHRVEICKHRPRRTDRQNRFLWPACVQPFGDYLREQGNSHFTDEMAHAVLKEMFLKKTVLDKKTGQELTYVQSSTELNTQEFNIYLEQIMEFLATECGFAVVDPERYRETDSEATVLSPASRRSVLAASKP